MPRPKDNARYNDAPLLADVARIMGAEPDISKAEAIRRATCRLPEPARGYAIQRLKRKKPESAPPAVAMPIPSAERMREAAGGSRVTPAKLAQLLRRVADEVEGGTLAATKEVRDAIAELARRRLWGVRKKRAV